MAIKHWSRWIGVVSVAWCSVAGATPARLCVLSDGELLKSETRAVAELGRQLGRKQPGIATGPAADDEKSAAKQLFAGEAIGALPAAWQGAPVVVVMTVLPPEGKLPNRRSRGVGTIAIVKPPSTEPIYREQIDGAVELSLQGEQLGAWLVKMVDLVTKAAP